MTKQKCVIAKILSVFMALGLLLGNTTVGYAFDSYIGGEIEQPYVNISKNTAQISISGITATCKAQLKANKSMSLKIKMELQKKKSSGYETVETWSSSKSGTLISMSKSRNINILCDYRLKVTYTAGSETTTSYAYPA